MNAILSVKYGLRRNGKCCYGYQLPANVLHDIGTMKSYASPGIEEASSSQAQVEECEDNIWDEIYFE